MSKDIEKYTDIDNDFYNLMKSEAADMTSLKEDVIEETVSDNEEDAYLEMMKLMSAEEESKIVYGASASESSADKSGSGGGNSSNSSDSSLQTDSSGTIVQSEQQSVYSSAEQNGTADETNSDVKVGTEDD